METEHWAGENTQSCSAERIKIRNTQSNSSNSIANERAIWDVLDTTRKLTTDDHSNKYEATETAGTNSYP
jgi:allantoicase